MTCLNGKQRFRGWPQVYCLGSTRSLIFIQNGVFLLIQAPPGDPSFLGLLFARHICRHICFKRKLMIKEDRLLVSNFINEGGNVFIPGLDASTTFLNNVSRCVCWCVCIWTRHWLGPIPSGVSLTGPSYQAASLSHTPTGQQPSWRPTALPTQPTHLTHNLLP